MKSARCPNRKLATELYGPRALTQRTLAFTATPTEEKGTSLAFPYRYVRLLAFYETRHCRHRICRSGYRGLLCRGRAPGHLCGQRPAQGGVASKRSDPNL